VSEYDAEQESWRAHRPAGEDELSFHFTKIHYSGRSIWFLGAYGAARYDPRTRAWATYTASTIESWDNGPLPSSVVSEGDSLWVVVGGRMLLFDPNLDAFSEFEHAHGLGEREVRFMALSGDYIWVATNAEIGRFDRVGRTWKFYGEAQGLETQGFLVAFVSGPNLFACAEDGSVSYLKISQERWYRTEAPPPMVGEGAAKISFLADERGTGVAIQPGNELVLKGSTSWTTLFDDGAGWSSPEGRSDLTLSGKVHGGRSLAGRYDDTDFEKTIYGVKFRGEDRDVLEELSLGYDRCEFGRDRLIRSHELLGASAQLGFGYTQTGPRKITLAARSGERRSGFDSDFFTGKRRDVELDVRDVDYLKGTFFLLDTLGGTEIVLAGSEILYLDDGALESNTPNTILDTTIAGVSGDFDKLYPILDYVLDNSTGMVRLSVPVDSLSLLAADYSSYSGRRELVIHSDSVRGYELTNKYTIGLSIIPRSLSVSIIDTLGQDHELSQFGIDADLDGRVDPYLVDFRMGTLSFPGRRPFPEEVYSQGIHIYTMRVTYSTTSSTYSLSHRNLVRLSETVRLDGAILERGDDYLVENTGGTLVILKDELVGDKSQIDVTYEYEIDSDEDFQLLDLRFDPNSTFRASARGMRFDDGERGVEASGLAHGSAEFRTKILGFDVRAPVELARSASDTMNGIAQRYSLYLSDPDMSISLGYRSYGDDFVSFSSEKGRYGEVRKAYTVDCESYLGDWVLGEVSLERKTFSADSARQEPLLDDGRIALGLIKERFPAVSLWLSGLDANRGPVDERLRKLGSDFYYGLTREELPRLPVVSLALRASFARTWWLEAVGDSSGRYDGGSLEAVSTLARGFTLGCEYLWGYGTQDSVGETSGAAEVRMSSSVDRIPGIDLYGKTEREAEDSPYGLPDEERDASTDWRDYGKAGISPGVWFAPLSFLDFEYEVSNHASRDLRSVPARLSLSERFLKSSHLPANRESESRVENFKSYVRPHLTVLLNLGYEKTRERDRHFDSENRRLRDRYTFRAEYRPRYRSTFTLYYDDASDRQSPLGRNKTLSPSLWWEEGWADWIFTKASVSHVSREESLGLIGTRTASLAPQVSATLRMRGVPALGDVEVTTDTSVRLTSVRNGTASEPTVYSTSLEMDVKPLRLLRLKTQLGLARGRETTAEAFITLSGTF